MKKFLRAKKGWLLAGMGALLVMTMVLSTRLISYTNAKYASELVVLDTGISAISNDDLDNLLKVIMNRRYPVGSIYMTTNPNHSTATVIDGLFGGTWEAFGKQMVPVGYAATNTTETNSAGAAYNPNGSVAFSNYFDAVPKTGGRTPGGVENNAQVSFGGQVSHSLPLTTKTANWTTATVSLTGGSVSLARSTAMTSNNTNLTLPYHRHQVQFGGSTSAYRSDRSSGSCCGSGSTVTMATSVSTGTSYHIVIGYTGSGAAFNVTATAPSMTGSYSSQPTITLNNPGWTVGQQALAGLPKGYTYTGNATMNDKTLQPYFICYMYIRKTPATVPSIP